MTLPPLPDDFPARGAPAAAGRDAAARPRAHAATSPAVVVLPPDAAAAGSASPVRVLPNVTVWHVYRLYATDGQLLYVGSTRWPGQRMAAHRRQKQWWPEVAATEFEDFTSELEARLREKEIWKAGRPLHNKVSPFRTKGEEYKRKQRPKSPAVLERQRIRRRVANMSAEAVAAENAASRERKKRRRDRIRSDPLLRERELARERERYYRNLERERQRAREKYYRKRSLGSNQEGPGLF